MTANLAHNKVLLCLLGRESRVIERAPVVGQSPVPPRVYRFNSFLSPASVAWLDVMSIYAQTTSPKSH